jgi:hypothetical protein
MVASYTLHHQLVGRLSPQPCPHVCNSCVSINARSLFSEHLRIDSTQHTFVCHLAE